jgi:hypothetical protein
VIESDDEGQRAHQQQRHHAHADLVVVHEARLFLVVRKLGAVLHNDIAQQLLPLELGSVSARPAGGGWS